MARAAGLLETAPDASGPLIFLGHEDIPSGIVGLVAGRLAEERYRPAVVYERQGEASRAGGRGLPEVAITSAPRGWLARAPAIDSDAALPLGALRGREIRALSLMAPFGQGNPEPTFLSRGVEVIECRTMGADGRHLRLKLGDRHGEGGRVTWPAVAFGLGQAGARGGRRRAGVYSLLAVCPGGAVGGGAGGRGARDPKGSRGEAGGRRPPARRGSPEGREREVRGARGAAPGVQ